MRIKFKFMPYEEKLQFYFENGYIHIYPSWTLENAYSAQILQFKDNRTISIEFGPFEYIEDAIEATNDWYNKNV